MRKPYQTMWRKIDANHMYSTFSYKKLLIKQKLQNSISSTYKKKKKKSGKKKKE